MFNIEDTVFYIDLVFPKAHSSLVKYRILELKLLSQSSHNKLSYDTKNFEF
jgi:hypothetical protein